MRLDRFLNIFFVAPVTSIFNCLINSIKVMGHEIVDYYYERKLGIVTWGHYREKEDPSEYGDEIKYVKQKCSYYLNWK